MAKEITKRDEAGSRLQTFERYELGKDYSPIESNDLSALLEMSIQSLERTKGGQAPKYPENELGLQIFQEQSINYLRYVQQVNEQESEDDKPRLIPDIESWATYMGLTRKTLLVYEKQRREEWGDFIGQVKNVIAALKKQLLSKNRIPVVFGMFDLCNNFGYSNTSEFKVEAIPARDRNSILTPEEIQARYKDMLDICSINSDGTENTDLPPFPTFDEE